MICKDCTAQKHELCRGGTWCDCQHRVQNIPPEILESIDRAITDVDTWVRRERPQRKDEQ